MVLMVSGAVAAGLHDSAFVQQADQAVLRR